MTANRRKKVNEGDMGVYELRIVFIDGKILELERVSDYGYNQTANAFFAAINGYRQFFNKDQVKYIGRIFDLDNGGR